MTRQLFCTFGIALTLAAGSAWAASTPEPANGPQPALQGVSADASPEMQAERDELAAQWEADARAAGLDPDQEEAKPAPGINK